MEPNRQQERKFLQVNNPAFREDAFDAGAVPAAEASTVNGAIGKTLFLLMLVLMTGVIGYAIPNIGIAIGCIIGTIVLGFVIGFKPHLAPSVSPVYALAQGYAVGVISFAINRAIGASIAERGGRGGASLIFNNAIPAAILGTALTVGVMLFLYKAQIIKVTETFKAVVLGATAAVFLLYLVVLALVFFVPSLQQMGIFRPTLTGILFSVLVIAIAAFNLILDFHWIDEAAAKRLPKYYEWYVGFGLMVTIVWLYVEILKLIWKLSARR
ncbi:MAG: Bax inhibitor-1/YccA family protein [Chthonomonas sp.]|nr:Bax inhibitor-1/YccA family protein [Chthonomonas sp.]